MSSCFLGQQIRDYIFKNSSNIPRIKVSIISYFLLPSGAESNILALYNDMTQAAPHVTSEDEDADELQPQASKSKTKKTDSSKPKQVRKPKSQATGSGSREAKAKSKSQAHDKPASPVVIPSGGETMEKGMQDFKIYNNHHTKAHIHISDGGQADAAESSSTLSSRPTGERPALPLG
jgi:hypothetical protein